MKTFGNTQNNFLSNKVFNDLEHVTQACLPGMESALQ